MLRAKYRRRPEPTKPFAAEQGPDYSIPRNPVFWVLTSIVAATEWFIFKQGAWQAALALVLVAVGALLKYRNEWH